jgi:hypothetical protein
MATPEKNEWYSKHVDAPWWSSEDYEVLDYRNHPFNDQLTQKYWKDIGFTQTKFTGDLYGMPNKTPDWVEQFKQVFPWNNWSWQLYRMEPGTVLPAHSDTYNKFRKLNKIENPNSIWRAVVFLENWQSGHYFEIDSRNLGYWKKGDYVVWQNSVIHLAANVGETMRYTLQITGTIDD